MTNIETTLRLRIGRVHSNQDPHDSYELQVTDERSGVDGPASGRPRT